MTSSTMSHNQDLIQKLLHWAQDCQWDTKSAQLCHITIAILFNFFQNLRGNLLPCFLSWMTFTDMLLNLAFFTFAMCLDICLHPGYKTLKQVVQRSSGGSGANEGLLYFPFFLKIQQQTHYTLQLLVVEFATATFF